jgi:hypothetical protein
MTTHHRTIQLKGIELDVEFYPAEPGDEGIEITALYAPGQRRNLSDLFTEEAFVEIANIIHEGFYK